MKGDRHLHKPLPVFLLFVRCNPPDVFQHLMSVEELALVKQRNPAKIFVFSCNHGQPQKTKPRAASRGLAKSLDQAIFQKFRNGNWKP